MGMNPTLPPTAGLNSIFYRIADDVSSGCSGYVYVLNRLSAPLLPNTQVLLRLQMEYADQANDNEVDCHDKVEQARHNQN